MMEQKEYNWTYVQGSSNIAAISYTAEDPLADFGILRIRFASGAEYSYDKVPNQLAVEFFESESKGKFFHANLRKYDGVKLEPILPEDVPIAELFDEPIETDGDGSPVDESLAEDLPAELPDASKYTGDWESEGGAAEPILPIPHRPRY